jgi:hypothetical protein
MTLVSLLRIAAAAQLAIALLNLVLARLLDWKADLDRMPLLLREVVHVHCWFISITLGIFGVMTLRFADAMAESSNEACRWLTAGIGVFWAIRTVLQVTYYSSSHWHGRQVRTVMHVALLATYGGLALVYGLAALGAGERN